MYQISRRGMFFMLGILVTVPAFARNKAEARTIALLYDSLISPFWVTAIRMMRRHAASRGWAVFEAVSNMDDNRQYAQLQSMIQRGVDGVIMVHTDNRAVIPAIRAANRANVPLVHFNRPPAENMGYSVAVVADNRMLMRQTVEALIARARATGRRHKAAILIGDLSDANAAARRDGFEDAIVANRDVVEVVARIATDWNPDKAFAGLTNALQAHPDLSMLVTSSDFLTPQIEQALKAAGKWHPRGHRDHVLIAGFDGDANGARNVAEGFYDVDGVQDLEREVAMSFEALEAMWAGKRPPKALIDPGFVLSRDTLSQDAQRTWGFAALQAAQSAQQATAVAATAAATGASGSVAPVGLFIASAGTFLAALLSLAALGDIALAWYPLAILVMAQLLVLLIGEIDLSMPAVLGLSSIIASALMTGPAAQFGDVTASWIGAIACIAVGALIGGLNGLSVAVLKMPSFIVTLATLMMGSGAAVWFASALSPTTSIGGLPTHFVSLGYGAVLGLPVALLMAGMVTLLIGYGLARTVHGRRLYAIGHNRAASAIAGVRVRTVTFVAFTLSGALAGLTSIIYTARIETGQPTLGATMLLDIVGAAVIGGISLFGGRGSVWMALGGALLLTVLDKSLQLLGLSLFLVLAIKGVAILAAAGFDIWRRARQGRDALSPPATTQTALEAAT